MCKWAILRISVDNIPLWPSLIYISIYLNSQVLYFFLTIKQIKVIFLEDGREVNAAQDQHAVLLDIKCLISMYSSYNVQITKAAAKLTR